ncbi:MAG: patatin-like phospholipase family protein [Actinomycetota bacterium]
MTIAFVLGGGGPLGASEIGMLRALLERNVRPDLILGTSVGAINGAAIAAEPTEQGLQALAEVWTSLEASGVLNSSLVGRVGTLARSRINLYDNTGLRALLEERLPNAFEELQIPFQCVAAGIERAGERWFSSGPLVDALVASCAVPGMLPPVEIDGEHFYDGGLVNSIPVDRAVRLGAREIYVLQVGRIEQPLNVPAKLWEVGLVAFEIARRHRFVTQMATLPAGVTAHVLPAGEAVSYTDLKQLRFSDRARAEGRADLSYEATIAYLDALEEEGT